MMRKVVFLLALLTSISRSVWSQDKPLAKPVDAYQTIWNEHNHEVRIKLIQSAWLETSTYQDPSTSIQGTSAFNAMVDNFYKTFPNATFTSEPWLVQGKFYTWAWKIYDGKKLMLTGRDVMEVNGGGQIISLVGFFESPHQSESREVAAKYFECLFKTSDFKAMSEIIAPGAIYYQAEGLPYGGTFTGFDNWMKMFIHASTFFDLEIEKEPTYFTDSTEGNVLLRFTIRCKAKKSGKSLSMPIAEHFEVKNGKIVSIRPFYFDTKGFSEFLTSN